jgi:Zn-dependent metalloprotease
MARHHSPSLAWSILLACAGVHPAFSAPGLKALEPGRIALIRSQEGDRVRTITRNLEASRMSLGLGMLDGLEVTSRITDAYGGTHVRYRQTYRGVEVFHGVLLGSMDASGRLETPIAALKGGISLEPVDLLPESRILELAAANQPCPGRLLPPRLTKVVFPTRLQGGIKARRGLDGTMTIDPFLSTAARRTKDAYRWAYQVECLLATPQGFRGTNLVIDGLTGDVLRKWDGVEHLDQAAIGTGVTQYNGSVVLNTVLRDDGVYELRDTTRATLPHPLASDFPEWGKVGIQTFFFDYTGPNANSSQTTPYTSAVDTWGDGGSFQWYTDARDGLRGQTSAADAHYAVQCTWDYFRNIHGREGGIDGKGSSPVNVMHIDDGSGGPWMNAAWAPSYFMMEYGDGAATGALASLDVIAHELSHGVNSYTANLQGAEGSGLNEANSDVNATMVRFYEWGAGGTGNTVPATTTQAPGGRNDRDFLWTIGAQLSTDGQSPMRWMYKPSKDGNSYDAWFDGIGTDDSHFSMGPANRAFYFMCNGASSVATDDTYASFLPGGMSGIGNDTAIRIWYHAMTKFVVEPESGYQELRKAMVASAEDLYPSSGSTSSPEVAAVKNAFAAINVGGADGAPDPVTVIFPSNPDSPFIDTQIVVAPSLVPIPPPRPLVTNATDPAVDFELGGLSVAYSAGGSLKDGLFTAPMINYGNLWPLKATSHQDPTRFGATLIYGASLDCDSDTELDACDLGALALSYGGVDTYPASNIYGSQNGCDDICLELFLEGFQNAFSL